MDTQPPPSFHYHHPSPSPTTRLTVTHSFSAPTVTGGSPLSRPLSHANPSDRSSRARPLHHAHPPPPTNSAPLLPSPPLFDPSIHPHRLRSDSPNSHHSSAHGSPHRSSGLSVKPPSSSSPPPQFPSFGPSHPARHRTTSNTNNASYPSIPYPGLIPARPSSSSPHSFSSTHQTPPNPSGGSTMVRRSSPLAQSNSITHDHSPPQPTLPSYRNSSASTATITSIPSTAIATPLVLPPNRPDHEAEEDSDTTSDVDLRPPGHRSTPGTSIDSSTSNFTSPEDVFSQTTHSNATDSLPERRPHKHSKQSLGNKLRRALNINALQENMIHNSIPELDPVVGNERLKSSSASIAGVPLSSSTTSKGKPGGLGAGRRFGFLNPKSNSSTDNLSISSTVSSASVMIRKLGNLGRSARRGNVMGLTKIFKDKNEAAANLEAENNKLNNSKTDKTKRLSTSQLQKNAASTSVTQVQAEVDRSLSAEFPGMTPAAAFIHKQKQQFAQQEAAAAAANSTVNHSQDSVRSKSKVSSGGELGSTVPMSATEARKKMIEKEKEKLKSSKKSRKWGFGTLVGGSNPSEATLPVSSSLEDFRPSSERESDAEESQEWDDTTVRQTKGEGSAPSGGKRSGKSVEELRDDDDDHDDEESDEYDMESLFGNSSSNAIASRPTGLRPRPSKEAVPKKGILKNAQNFSQESHLSPASMQSKSLSAATTPDSPASVQLAEDPHQVLPQLGKSPSALLLGIASAGPDLSLSFGSLAIKERRAKFAQHLSVHTTWPAAIYDRRGELATCNRLTPTLAQRIKEEINAFKMEEMDVHSASRAHTHFFVVSLEKLSRPLPICIPKDSCTA